MTPVVTPDEMRAIDAAAPEPVEALVERAGAAVARTAIRMMGGSYGRTVAVLAGPGNNGADGRVAADRLRARGATVRVYEATDLPPVIRPVDLLIDAAFGTGFRGAWKPPQCDARQVLAVDVPTGLDGATGVITPGTLRADVTVTFAAAKPGHVLGSGPDVVGALEVADIGLDVGSATMSIVDADDVREWLPSRGRTTHKWMHALRIVAGSEGMTGAGHLAAAAGQRAGATYVALSSPGVEADAPIEVVGVRLPAVGWAETVLADLHRFQSLVIGPGLGREEHTIASVVRTVTDALVPAVIDGDGLFALAWNDEGTPAFLRAREVPTILTPHDGEYGLLLGTRPGTDRIAAARRLVDVSGAIVLLKGPTTVVAAPDGSVRLVTNGDQRLATAGTGDVLAGIIGALLASGVEPVRAAAAGTWLHARAADGLPPVGGVAGDLIDAIAGAAADVAAGGS